MYNVISVHDCSVCRFRTVLKSVQKQLKLIVIWLL